MRTVPRELPISLKRKLVQLMIWPIMSYGSETWLYLKSVQNMIKVFERWCYRRMLRISWTEHVTNEEVFNTANTKPTLLDGLLKRRLAFHGHLVRKYGITLDLVQLMIWPIMSYGSEIWIYLKSVQNMIKVFERWCYRRMLRISWTEHVTNEEVFNTANTKPTLLDGLLKRRLAFHGHLVRKYGITHST